MKVVNFNFGHNDVMETKFEEFNLLVKEHDDTSGLTRSSEPFLWQERQNHCEPICN